jgi:GTP-binding protein HflX
VPYPLIALVGYTNAGKSTLFNRLTHADVVAQDQLFATLDPTIRAATLPSGLSVLLSDTVGFISNLPTELVAAFRATLEEVVNADILLHVRDIAHEDSAAQKNDVLGVLKSLFGKEAKLDHLIEVHNKIDQWKADNHQDNYVPAGDALAVSAITGEGCEALLARIDAMLSATLLATYDYHIPHADGRAIAWLYANGQVMTHAENEWNAHYRVRLSAANAARFTREFDY